MATALVHPAYKSVSHIHVPLWVRVIGRKIISTHFICRKKYIFLALHERNKNKKTVSNKVMGEFTTPNAHVCAWCCSMGGLPHLRKNRDLRLLFLAGKFAWFPLFGTEDAGCDGSLPTICILPILPLLFFPRTLYFPETQPTITNYAQKFFGKG